MVEQEEQLVDKQGDKRLIHQIEHVFPGTRIEVNGGWRPIRLVRKKGCEECRNA